LDQGSAIHPLPRKFRGIRDSDSARRGAPSVIAAVYFRLKNTDAVSFLAACSGQGLLGGAPGPDLVRFVTHHGISPADVQRALVICREALRG
jgi:threonine aldolase